MITENLQKLYQQYTGMPAEEIIEMPASGSNRRYFRLTGVQSLIGVYGTSVEENEAFLYMAEHFKKKNLPVPQVRCVPSCRGRLASRTSAISRCSPPPCSAGGRYSGPAPSRRFRT